MACRDRVMERTIRLAPENRRILIRRNSTANRLREGCDEMNGKPRCLR